MLALKRKFPDPTEQAEAKVGLTKKELNETLDKIGRSFTLDELNVNNS